MCVYMKPQPLRLILPDQKRLRAAFNTVMEQAGFEFIKETPRAASGITRDRTGVLPGIETYEFRSEVALEWLAEGAADMAIVGEDTLRETQAQAGTMEVMPRTLINMDRIAACSMWIAAAPEIYIQDLKDLDSMRLATSYPALLQQILEEQGVKPSKVIAQKGGVESTITAGRADAILEIVQTGESLRQNGLEKKLPVFNSCAQLVRTNENRAPADESLIAAFAARVQQALDAPQQAQKPVALAKAPKPATPARVLCDNPAIFAATVPVNQKPWQQTDTTPTLSPAISALTLSR